MLLVTSLSAASGGLAINQPFIAWICQYFISLRAATGVINEAHDTLLSLEYLIELLARPIFHTCIKCTKFLETFNVFVDSLSTPARFNAADKLLLCLAVTLS